jgi:hypothetical protein
MWISRIQEFGNGQWIEVVEILSPVMFFCISDIAPSDYNDKVSFNYCELKYLVSTVKKSA